MRAPRLSLALLAALGLAGCETFPEVDAAADPRAMAAPYPALLQVDEVPVPTPPPETDPGAALAAEGAALQARADSLRALPAP